MKELGMEEYYLNTSKAKRYIILSLVFYFGWLLSFPFYGPVLYAAAPSVEYRGFSLSFIFVLFHTLAFLVGGLLLKNVKLWKNLAAAGLGTTLVTSTALIFSPPAIWPWAMAVFGAAGAVYILGWSYPYTTLIAAADRLKLMVTIIIGANIIYIFFNVLSQIAAPAVVLVIAPIPLLLALLLLLFLAPPSELETPRSAPVNQRGSFPVPLILIFCLFIAGLYLCSGFMYNIMQPFPSQGSSIFIYYRYLPYIAVLVIMWQFGQRLQRYFSIYMGASLLGLAFVSFALASGNTAELFMTESLIEAAFALLDLFVWTVLGDLAFIFGAPFQFFGFALAAMLFSILAGELIGTQLLRMGEHYRLVTALFAATAIFLTFSVIPWLNERIQQNLRYLTNFNKEVINDPDHEEVPTGETSLSRAVNLLPPDQKLTPREAEITALLLKGLTNRIIAEQLFISENTLKTHLKNIYPKFGITQKRELLSLVLAKKKDKFFTGAE